MNYVAILVLVLQTCQSSLNLIEINRTATVSVLTTAALNKKDKMALLLLFVLSVLAVTTNRPPIAAQVNGFSTHSYQFSAAGILYSEFANALRRSLQCVTLARCPFVSPL